MCIYVGSVPMCEFMCGMYMCEYTCEHVHVKTRV